MANEYAISTAPFQSVPGIFSKIARAGFEEIELSGSRAMMQQWLGDPAALHQTVTDAGLVIRSVHTPDHGWDNGSLDDDLLATSVSVVEQTFRQAAELGAEYVIVHPNRRAEAPVGEYAGVWERSRSSLVHLAEVAAGFGVKMAVENMPWRDRSGLLALDSAMPGASVPQILGLIEGLGEHVGVCLDVGHSNVVGLSAAQEARDAGDRLFCLHIQDNDGMGDDQHLLPGEGTVDWPAFLLALDEIRFEGMRTFEVLRGHQPDGLLCGMSDLAGKWGSSARGAL